jgi:hypothetical protein
MERSGRAKWAGRPKAAQTRARAGGRRERESQWTGLTTRGPGWDPLVSDSVHRAEGARGARARAGEGRGARARFTEEWMRRVHAQPHGLRWNARTGGVDRGRPDPTSAELALTWRLRGCHAGWREEDEGAGREWTAGGGSFSGAPCDDEGRRGVHRDDEGEGEGASQRLGFTGGSPSAADFGGGNRRREKGEMATRSRGANSWR